MWWILGAAVLHSSALLCSSKCVTESPAKTCYDRACVIRAGRLLNAMNPEADPCENFVEFACGGIFQDDDALGLNNSLPSADRETENIQLQLLETFKIGAQKWSPQMPQMKALKFFKSCRRSWHTRKHATLLLHSMAVELGVPDLLQRPRRGKQSSTPPTTFGGALRLLREQYGVRLSPNVLRMRVEGKCLHIVNFGEFSKIDTSMTLEQLNFFNSPEEKEDLDVFENNFYELVDPTVCTNSDESKYRDISLGELIKEAPKFGWPEFLNLKENSSMVELSPCIPETSRQLAAMMEEYPQLTKKFLIASAMKILWMQTDVDVAANKCLTLTKNYFSEVMTSIMKNGESVPDVQPVARMAEQMRSALARRMERADWLDPATRDQYLDKLTHLRIHIGYPDVVADIKALRQFHSSLKFSGNLLEDLKQIARWREEMSASHCDLDLWYQTMHPLEVNAFNDPYLQTIAIPLGQFRGDNYDHRLPSSVNYAGIGRTIGHELMHAFDNSGRNFDRWCDDIITTNLTETYLNRGESCLVEYYNELGLDGITVNGTSTLGENIADVFGLQLSYESWKEELESTGPEPLLPGVPYTPEQIFFISFAQASCDDPNEDTLEEIKADVHAAGYARVFGSTAQSPEFATAFSCPIEKQVNRCKLW